MTHFIEEELLIQVLKSECRAEEDESVQEEESNHCPAVKVSDDEGGNNVEKRCDGCWRELFSDDSKRFIFDAILTATQFDETLVI